jgi:3',5'-cyclic AMP phosphodiesterase CpdA
MSHRRDTAEAAALRELSAPWRTRLQLELLTRTERSPYETFSFAVLGDCEPGRFWIFRALFNQQGVFSRQLSAIQSHSIDFAIQLGDMVSRGLPGNYVNFFRELSGLSVEKPYLTVIGNHDRHNPHGRSNSKVYRSIFGRNNYYFERGGARFVSLDSSSGRLSKAQFKWLRLVLDTPLRKVVLTHMPPALLELWGSSSAVKRMGGFTEGAEEFVEVMGSSGVDRVYMGHVHAFGVQDYKDVRYVLTGGGGSPLFPCGATDKFHHFLTVTVGPSGIQERVHTLEGESFAIPSGKVLLAAA